MIAHGQLEYPMYWFVEYEKPLLGATRPNICRRSGQSDELLLVSYSVLFTFAIINALIQNHC